MENRIFFTQVFFSVLTVSFCIGMIAHNPSTQTSSIYLPIITSVVGVWLPQPKSTEKANIVPNDENV
jgi:uncharacterized membrane protein